MRIVYFIASQFDYRQIIYPGVGGPFGRALGWPVESLAHLGEASFDVAVVDPRLQAEDIAYIEAYLQRPAAARRPVFFKITDPETPESRNPGQRYSFEQANRPGVHYASAYDPAGPMLDFVQTLTTSRLARLPFVYDSSREIDVPMEARKRRILMSGAIKLHIYPLRRKLRRTRRWNPALHLTVDILKHPGYRDAGHKVRHEITGDKYIAKAAEYTHFFTCPSIYSVELMKYVECAYAGCVPMGEAPRSLAHEVRDYFVPWSGGAWDLVRAACMDVAEARQRASGYRALMKQLRDPARVVAEFERVAAETA